MPDTTSPESGQPQVPVNMYETEGAIVVVAPFPGVMPGDVQVELENRQLTMRAAVRSEASKRDYLMHEWHWGPWERTVEIPDGFGGEVSASFGNGQLAVRIIRGAAPGGRQTITPGSSGS